MTDWTAGYVADIGYTYGYYAELNPLRIKLAFLNAGIAFPEIVTACELAFGQGISINIHAAASAVEWHGTDFNPSQAAFAREMAAVSGSGAHLHDESFSEFCQRSDLPDFDFVGMHGTWSWISTENQAVIVDFLRRKLKVGGVLYISYNTQPGLAAMVPMRHLLTQHAEVMAAPGRGIVSRIDAALEFGDRLMAANPIYARANPQMAERLKRIMDHNRHYLAHEYFNKDWQPIHFAEMADWLEPAKLNYACSATVLECVDVINLTTEQQAFLQDIPDAMFRETVRDFMVNQQFRRDYWVKGERPLSTLDRQEGLLNQRVILVSPRAEISLKTTVARGEAELNESIYGPVLDALSDHGVKTIGQIEQAVKDKGISFPYVLQAVLVLIGKGDLIPVQDDKAIAHAKGSARKLNQYLMQKARGSDDINYLASPVSGGGVQVSRFQQLFLAAFAQGRRQPADWAAYVWEVLAAQGQTLIRDGKLLDTVEANMAELTAQADDLAKKGLPVLKTLGIA
jgi:SAM-dependent methyltransferase